MDVDLIQPAGAVMSSGRFEHNPASCHATEAALNVSHMFLNRVVKSRVAGHALEIDLD
jgi:hypothetical protein